MKSLLLQTHAFLKRALTPRCDQSAISFYVAAHVIGGRIRDAVGLLRAAGEANEPSL
jgi:hypothetical protein